MKSIPRPVRGVTGAGSPLSLELDATIPTPHPLDPYAKDLTGRRYGKLTVIRPVAKARRGYLWECHCDCGGAKTTPGYNLQRGATHHCGCSRIPSVRPRDRTGERYGKLTVLASKTGSEGERLWECLCDCGTETTIVADDRKRLRATSCGCLTQGTSEGRLHPQADDLAARRFGRLTVLRVAGRKSGLVWECRCECGVIKAVRANSLLSGGTVSCGCYQRERARELHKGKPLPGRAPDDLYAWRDLFRSYRRTAERRGLAWELGESEAIELFQGACHYCGAPPSQIAGHRRRVNPSPVLYNGIDRRESAHGYIPDNVVPCCGRCNAAKSASSYHEFIDWVARVYRHLGASGTIQRPS